MFLGPLFTPSDIDVWQLQLSILIALYIYDITLIKLH